MNTAFDIIVIILSCLLGIFLILSIIAAVLILRLVAALRRIVSKGEQIVDNAEAIGETLRKHAGAVTIVRAFSELLSHARKHRRED